MTIICKACGYDSNPDGLEFCDACGAELVTTGTDSTPIPEPPSQESTIPTTVRLDLDDVNNSPESQPQPLTPSTPSTAKLISKQSNAPVGEFAIENYALIGIFDPDLGPVDIDLEGFLGGETVSRQHGEIYWENQQWKIKDLGSTNGIFIKPCGQNRFGARITTPQGLNSGDEIAIAKVRFLFQI